MKRFLLSLILFFSVLQLVVSQNYSGALDIGIGQVVKHKEDLNYENPGIGKIIQWSIIRESYGYSNWERYWRKPELDLSLLYVDFGNKNQLGHAFALIPGARFEVFKTNRFITQIHFGVGIAYLTKTYDVNDNPRNNAIGSHWNNGTLLRLISSYDFNNRTQLSLSVSANHFSNGLTVSPNSGINSFGIHLGLRHRFIETPFDSSRYKEDVLLSRKYGFLLQTGIGFSNNIVPDGPRYPVNTYTVLGIFKLSPFQYLEAGFEYEYHSGIYEFQRQIYTDENIAKDRATRVSLVMADELFMGDISFRFQLGYYLDIPEKKTGDPVYFKLNTNYSPKRLYVKGIQPYVGVLLKSHFAVAEYLSVVIGVRT